MPDPRDFLPPPPWKIPPELRGTARIKRMTEHEMISALAIGSITPAEVYATFGDCVLTKGVIGKYEEYKSACERPDLYWQERIDNLREQIRELEEKKRRREPPPVPYWF